MQFDKDINGKFSDIFLKLRSIILSIEEMSELKNAHQTSYRDSYDRVTCILRTDDEKLTWVLGQGAKLESKYPFLEGHGKIVRHLYFKNVDEVNEDLIREILEESLILNIEAVELKKLRKR